MASALASSPSQAPRVRFVTAQASLTRRKPAPRRHERAFREREVLQGALGVDAGERIRWDLPFA